MGLREQILAVRDVRLEKLDVPEWETEVHLKSWSGLERSRALAVFGKMDDTSVAKVVAMSVCDADGATVFTDKDFGELAKKNGEVLERIALAACKHNGINKVEQAKNESGSTPN